MQGLFNFFRRHALAIAAVPHPKSQVQKHQWQKNGQQVRAHADLST
jgi:hypothetical protein